MIDGAPSVLYDAVALLPARRRWTICCRNPRRAISSPMLSPIASSSAHVEAATPLFAKAGHRRGGFRRGLHCAGSAEGRGGLCREARPIAGLGPRAQRQDEIAQRWRSCPNSTGPPMSGRRRDIPPPFLALSPLARCGWPLAGIAFGWEAFGTLAIFMMTLFIQRTNRRDNLALHAKLDELLRVDNDARSELTHLDEQEPEASSSIVMKKCASPTPD